jgi:capsular polysaccharide transport system permease protein
VIQPVGADVRLRRSPVQRTVAALHTYRWFLALVILPTLLAAGYYWLIAADQYESESHFLVRTAEQQRPVNTGGLSQVLAAAGGQNSSPEAMSVADYLTSHDVVAALRQQVNLVQRYQRADVDFFSRLRGDHPMNEQLLQYYLKQTNVEVNSNTGITVVRARAFTPQDAYVIATKLLGLGERRINSLNQQSYHDALASQERQLRDARTELSRAQQAISAFRAQQGDIDPTGTGTAQTGLIAQLTNTLTQAEAQLVSVGQTISRSSPQYVALSRRVQALRTQIAAQQARLAGSGTTIASHVASYNELQLRQEFASKRYEAVAAALDHAREQTLNKQLYLVRVVDPNLPEKAQYPKRFRIVGTLFLGLLVAYGIGWMIVAGVREHAA